MTSSVDSCAADYFINWSSYLVVCALRRSDSVEPVYQGTGSFLNFIMVKLLIIFSISWGH